MSSRYLEMVRGQRRRGGGGAGGVQFTAKSLLTLVALVSMLASSVYWWGVQRQLTDSTLIAIAFTAILVLAPPALTSFLIPWSPGGMLLQKINARTWGYLVVIGCSLYLIYYSFEIQYSWWAAQPTVADTDLVLQQVIIGIIGFIIIPALLWTPVTSEELMEQVRQAHLVKRYEIQTQADIAILRATLLRAQEQTLKGFANLTTQEKHELSDVMRGLVSGIDQTLKDIGQSVKVVSGATIPFEALDDNADIKGYLDYIHSSLTGNSLVPQRRERNEVVSQQDDYRGRREIVPRQPDYSYDDPRQDLGDYGRGQEEDYQEPPRRADTAANRRTAQRRSSTSPRQQPRQSRPSADEYED